MRISNNYNYSFQGINKTVKHHFFSDIENIKKMQRLNSQNYYAQNIIGTVPSAWVRDIPQQKREAFIKNIYDILAEYSNMGKKPDRTLIDRQTEELQAKLRAAGLDVQKITRNAYRGSQGGVYVITVKEGDKEKNYAYKIFYKKENDKNSKHVAERYLAEQNHGNFYEQRFAQFVQSSCSPRTNIKKMHFGDIESAYTLSDYISDSHERTTRVPPQLYGFTFMDNHQDNFYKNYIIDYGGFIPSNAMLRNPEARKKAFAISKLPQGEKERQWQQRFAKIIQEINPQMLRPATTEVLALSATIPTLNYYQGKQAMLNMIKLIPSMPESLQEQVGSILSSHMFDLAESYEREGNLNKRIFTDLMALRFPRVSNNILSSRLGYEYCKRYNLPEK